VIPGGIARLRAALVSGEPRCARQTKVAACGRPSPGGQRRPGAWRCSRRRSAQRGCGACSLGSP